MVKPLVSVIIPTHNRADLVEGAIHSVLGQDGRGILFDLEIIVVDDASTDNTSEKVTQFPSVQYLKLCANRKLPAARNVGIQASTGEYIAFLDDDDLWLPHRLKVQVPVLQNSPDIGVVYGQGLAVNAAGDVVVWPSTGSSGNVFEYFLRQTDDFVNVDTWLVRREAFETAGLFDETLLSMEHLDMALRLAFHFQWKFVLGPLCYGRLSSGGMWVTNTLNGNNDRIISYVIDKALDLVPRDEGFEHLCRTAKGAAASMIAGQLWHYGGREAVRTYLLESLHRHPWLLEAPEVKAPINRLVRESSALSENPASVVRVLADDLFTAAGYSQNLSSSKWRRCFADLLSQAALGFRASGSPRRAMSIELYACAQRIAFALCYARECFPRLAHRVSEAFFGLGSSHR